MVAIGIGFFSSDAMAMKKKAGKTGQNTKKSQKDSRVSTERFPTPDFPRPVIRPTPVKIQFKENRGGVSTKGERYSGYSKEGGHGKFVALKVSHFLRKVNVSFKLAPAIGFEAVGAQYVKPASSAKNKNPDGLIKVEYKEGLTFDKSPVLSLELSHLDGRFGKFKIPIIDSNNELIGELSFEIKRPKKEIQPIARPLGE